MELFRSTFPTVSKQETDNSPFNGKREVAVGIYSHVNLSVGQIQDACEVAGVDSQDLHDLSGIARPIRSGKQLQEVWSRLRPSVDTFLRGGTSVALFGVFPPPLQARFVEADRRESRPNVFLFESMNERTDGGRRNHLEWEMTGEYALSV
jgi:hypothetical protein